MAAFMPKHKNIYLSNLLAFGQHLTTHNDLYVAKMSANML
jgi:hypothetical protein